MMGKLRNSIIISHVESIGLTYDKSETYCAIDLVEDVEPSLGENVKTLKFSRRISDEKEQLIVQC